MVSGWLEYKVAHSTIAQWIKTSLTRIPFHISPSRDPSANSNSVETMLLHRRNGGFSILEDLAPGMRSRTGTGYVQCAVRPTSWRRKHRDIRQASLRFHGRKVKPNFLESYGVDSWGTLSIKGPISRSTVCMPPPWISCAARNDGNFRSNAGRMSSQVISMHKPIFVSR